MPVEPVCIEPRGESGTVIARFDSHLADHPSP